MKIVIGGATGFIGTAVVRACAEDGHEIVALVRGDEGVLGAKSVRWDGRDVAGWASEIDGADVAMNLSGAPIGLPWNSANRAKIVDSRVNSTAAFRMAIEKAARPPRVWLNASAIGYYGDAGQREVDETSPPGLGFLAEICQHWEDEAVSDRTRVVLLRTGIVLGRDGGSLPLLAKLAKAFIGGAVGDGRQYIPWVHLEDHVRLMRWCVLGNVSGPVNLCAPRPVSNGEMMSTLRSVLGRPWAPPAPKLALKLLGAVGGPDPSLAMMSTRAVPRVAREKGFTFRWPDLEPALRDLLAK